MCEGGVLRYNDAFGGHNGVFLGYNDIFLDIIFFRI